MTSKENWEKTVAWLKEHMKAEGYVDWDGSLSNYEVGHLISYFCQEAERREKRSREMGKEEGFTDNAVS